jgi:hypothetical protein
MPMKVADVIQCEIARLERQLDDYKRAAKACASDRQKAEQAERNERNTHGRIEELRANLKLVARE